MKINYKEIKTIKKVVLGVEMYIPINQYLTYETDYENTAESRLIPLIKSGKIKTPYQFLRFLMEEGDKHWNNFPFNTYYWKTKEKLVREKDTHSRRSLTDLLGLYITYFPNRNRESSIIKFIREFKQFCLEYNYIGHYCTSPEKVVFVKNVYGFKEAKFKNSPMSTITWALYEELGEYDEDYCDDEGYEGVECPYTGYFIDEPMDYEYTWVDPYNVCAEDGITPEDMRLLFEKA